MCMPLLPDNEPPIVVSKEPTVAGCASIDATVAGVTCGDTCSIMMPADPDENALPAPMEASPAVCTAMPVVATPDDAPTRPAAPPPEIVDDTNCLAAVVAVSAEQAALCNAEGRFFGSIITPAFLRFTLA